MGDMNGDGCVNLVVTNAESKTVSILQGNGDGTFTLAASYAVGPEPYSVALGLHNGGGPLHCANQGSEYEYSGPWFYPSRGVSGGC